MLRHLQQLCTVCVGSDAATGSEAQAQDVTPQLGPLGRPPTLQLTSLRSPEEGAGSGGVISVTFLLALALPTVAPS